MGSRKLTLFLPAGPKSEEHLRKESMEILAPQSVHLKFESVDVRNKENRHRIIRANLPGLLVLTGKEPFPKPDQVAGLLEEINFPVFLLGEDSVLDLD
jgi:hypothetical protein